MPHNQSLQVLKQGSARHAPPNERVVFAFDRWSSHSTIPPLSTTVLPQMSVKQPTELYKTSVIDVAVYGSADSTIDLLLDEVLTKMVKPGQKLSLRTAPIYLEESAASDVEEAVTDDELPASQASSLATSMLRRLPANSSSDEPNSSNQVAKTNKLLQTKLFGQVRKAGVERLDPVALKRKRSLEEQGPALKKPKDVGLGINT